MKSHMVLMLLVCILPLIVIFFAPAVLPGDSLSLFLFLLVCFGAHFFLMSGMHGGETPGGHESEGGHHDSHKRS